MNETAGTWIGGIAARSLIGAAAIPKGGFPFPFRGGEDVRDGRLMEGLVSQASRRLWLTGAQQQSLRALLRQLQRARQMLAADQDGARAGILDLLDAPRLDRHASLQLVKQRARAVEAGAPAIIEALADFHDSLDETQRIRLQTFLATRLDIGYEFAEVAI